MNTTVDIDHELDQYERACAGFDPLRPDARAEVARRWHHGIKLFDTLLMTGSNSDESARLRDAVTALATRWL